MRIGLIDVDGHNFPNIPLMKISAYHNSVGDNVTWYRNDGEIYDVVYMSKVFSFSKDYTETINARKIVRGGSGYAIQLVDGKECYVKSLDQDLPEHIEKMYPDYLIYPELTNNHAFGQLTKGCPRGCDFCHVKDKEGRRSVKVADLSDFWRGQEYITLCDPNILACKDCMELLQQLVDSRARIDFNQGIDVRLATPEKIEMLNRIRIKSIHLAWDRPEEDLTEHFKRFSELYKRKSPSGKVVYVLVNFNSTIEQDLHRIYTLRALKYDPYIMIYDKEHCSRIHKDMQRWVNNRIIWRGTSRFEDYRPTRKT